MAIGGTLGSLVRWGLIELGSPDDRGWLLVAINAVGSLLLGGLIGGRERLTPDRLLALGTGFTGGLTTFSGYAVTVAGDLEQGRLAAAAAGGLGTPVLALVGAGIGFRIVRVVIAARAGRRRRRIEASGRTGGRR